MKAKLISHPSSTIQESVSSENFSTSSKLGLVELFAGAGGLAQGFLQTQHYDLIALSDIDEKARTTFKENYPSPDIEYIREDIKDLKTKQLLQKANGRRVSGVLGGPPCQGFSLAGLKRPDDERNQYIGDYVRFVKALKPDFLLMENVPQVIFHPQFKALIEALEKDFEIRFTVLNAAQYGVAQTRHRAFVLAFHRRLGITPAFPAPTHSFVKDFIFNYRRQRLENPRNKSADKDGILGADPSVVRAFKETSAEYRGIGEVKPLVTVGQAIGDLVDCQASSVPNHIPRIHQGKLLELINLIPEGGGLEDVDAQYHPKSHYSQSESEYEHMAKCASDVVQFRVDEEVFTGKAYDISPPERSQIPKPQVHIRDGTITPQEREFGHYRRPDAYGEMVREGIRRERTILERIISARNKPPIFAGAVKSTQMRVLSRLVNWYISKGSATTFGHAIEPQWNVSRAAAISDNAAMTSLLAELPNNPNEGRYYVTCALVRQFPSLTEYYNYDLKESWLDFFEKKKEQALAEYDTHGGSLPYHATVDLADDDFIFMCENADFVYFYIGHTAGDPPPMIPRYEFLTSLREKSSEKASSAVLDLVQRLVDAIDAAGLAYDRDHNFMSSNTLVKILPYPIQQAHEYAKTLGKKLESELRSIVISRLIEFKKLRSSASDIIVRPVAVRDYLERFKRALGEEKNGADEIR